MRLMLGTKDHPSLLVNVGQEHSPTHFDFRVVNGEWDGTFNNGYVTVWYPGGPWTELDKTEILCDNQDRLRSIPWYDYQTVFDNFDNPNYVAPKQDKYFVPSWWEDDIPF